MAVRLVAQEGVGAARPFLKWAGGKRASIPKLSRLGLLPRPAAIERYIEPFVGGGAMFFYLRPRTAILNDLNYELVTTYRVIQKEPSALIERLRDLEAEYHPRDEDSRKEHFYAVRTQNPQDLSAVEMAARMIYLNRTGFNGLYRVNSQGEFNVPMGRYRKPAICDAANLRAVSAALQETRILHLDFRKLARFGKEGDFIYCDPPYDPLTETAKFTSYTKDGFGAREQERLAKMAESWHQKGARVLLSNHDTPRIRKLFDGPPFTLHPLKIHRAINSKSTARGAVGELGVSTFIPTQVKLEARS